MQVVVALVGMFADVEGVVDDVANPDWVVDGPGNCWPCWLDTGWLCVVVEHGNTVSDGSSRVGPGWELFGPVVGCLLVAREQCPWPPGLRLRAAGGEHCPATIVSFFVFEHPFLS